MRPPCSCYMPVYWAANVSYSAQLLMKLKWQNVEESPKQEAYSISHKSPKQEASSISHKTKTWIMFCISYFMSNLKNPQNREVFKTEFACIFNEIYMSLLCTVSCYREQRKESNFSPCKIQIIFHCAQVRVYKFPPRTFILQVTHEILLTNGLANGRPSVCPSAGIVWCVSVTLR
jgi:hypothetical protein